jgi:hypothetical protein
MDGGEGAVGCEQGSISGARRSPSEVELRAPVAACMQPLGILHGLACCNQRVCAESDASAVPRKHGVQRRTTASARAFVGRSLRRSVAPAELSLPSAPARVRIGPLAFYQLTWVPGRGHDFKHGLALMASARRLAALRIQRRRGACPGPPNLLLGIQRVFHARCKEREQPARCGAQSGLADERQSRARKIVLEERNLSDAIASMQHICAGRFRVEKHRASHE